MTSIENLRGQFEYEAWANRETLSSIQISDSPPARAVRVFAHVLGTACLWHARLIQTPSPCPVWPDWPAGRCAEECDTMPAVWTAYLGDQDEERLSVPVAYANSKGESFRSTRKAILHHVLFHAAYHRGQIAMLLRDAGIEPAYTDYIHYVRQGFGRYA